MLTRLGWFAVRRRRLVMVATVLFMVAAGEFGTGAFGVLKSAGSDDPSLESFPASELLEAEFGGGDPNVVLVLTSDGRDLDDHTAGVELPTRFDGMEGVAQVTSYWSTGGNQSVRGADGDTALVVARLSETRTLLRSDNTGLAVCCEEVEYHTSLTTTRNPAS